MSEFVCCLASPDAFGREEGGKTRLLNILMQLRKCVDHPYLFDGEAPPPSQRHHRLKEELAFGLER